MELFQLPIGSEAKFDVSLTGANPVISISYDGAEMGATVSITVKGVAALELIRKIAPSNKLLGEVVDVAEGYLKSRA